jgi:hypothetical protein
MSFLTPLFLAGVLAVAGPIIFHLIRRSARERTPFSSLLFLRPTAPKTTRSRKLEHFWLLLLRCLCLAALAFAFARPFFAKDMPPDLASKRRQSVILIDTSASMRRAGFWEKARAIANEYIGKAEPGDEFALMTFDRQPRTIFTMSEWSSWPADQRAALAKQRLDALSPGWMGTRMGLALTEAAAQLQNRSDRQTPGRRSVVLISDMQEGAKLDGLQGREWPSGMRVIVERIAGKPQSNAGVEILDQMPPGARVTNSKDSRTEKFRLAWKGASDSLEIYLPPGQTRTFATPKLLPGTKTGALQLSGDDADFDNTSWFAAPETEKVSICYLGDDRADDSSKPLYYLRLVFPASPRRNVKITGPEALSSAGFAVVPGALDAGKITGLRDWVSGGKTALLLLNAESLAVLEELLDAPNIHSEVVADNYALLGQIDFKHPIFAPFDDPHYSDFTHIHFWKHARWEIPESAKANVLAKFDDKSPALTQIPIGKGNLLVLASGWQPDESQLAVSSKFPPLMETMLDWSGSGAPGRFQFRTGDTIPAPHFTDAEVQWKKPDGQTRILPAGGAFSETEEPGIYTASSGGKERRFGVNLPLEESRVAPMSADELARLGVPVGPATEEPESVSVIRQRQMQRTELENSQKLWRWFIVAALAFLCGEIILAGSLSRVQPAGATQ